jgi:uncharacterized membrane protein
MESRIKLLGHPAHQLLVPIPLGGLVFSVCMDGIYTATSRSEYASAAKHALTFGLGAGLVAAPFGVVDYLAIPPGTRAKRVGLQHAATNLLTLGLFAASRLLRAKNETSGAARCLSGSAFILSGLAAWFGGELVNRLGVGMSDGANLDAPSSLSNTPPVDALIGEASDVSLNRPLQVPNVP